MTTITLKHPLVGQGINGDDLTTLTLAPLTTGHLRKTANIANAELREYAIIEHLTGLTPGQVDRLAPADLEAIQEVLRPLLPNGLTTGLLLSGFSLSSLVGDPATLTSLQQKTLGGGLPALTT